MDSAASRQLTTFGRDVGEQNVVDEHANYVRYLFADGLDVGACSGRTEATDINLRS
jgi:hypothetical protein